MKILFVISYINAASWEMYYSEGIASLSASVRQTGNHATDLYIIKNKTSFKKFSQYVKETRPDVVGFSTTAVQYAGVVWLAKKLKQQYPRLKIIVGGVHCTLNPEKVITETCFDAVCVGEGEDSLADYLQSVARHEDETKIRGMWVRKGKKIYRNVFRGPVVLDDLPMPDRQLFAEKGLDVYRGPIWGKPGLKGGSFMMSRGCLFDCAYCASPALNKAFGHSYYRLLSPANGIKQLKESIEKYHYDYITFVDDTFLLDKKWFFEFMEMYALEIKVPFNCQTRAETVDTLSANALKKAGCYLVILGIESGDEWLRSTILNKRISNQSVEHAVRLLHEAGIQVNSYNMMGLPEETPQLFKKTLLLNAKARVDNPYLFIFFPYEGTQLYTYCVEHSLLPPMHLMSSFVEREDSVLRMSQFLHEDILYYFHHFGTLFSLINSKPHSTFRRIKFELIFGWPILLNRIHFGWLKRRLYRITDLRILSIRGMMRKWVTT